MLFFGHSKLKPIDYVALFNIQEESADLTESIASSTVSQTKKTTSTTYYTSGKKKPHEASVQLASVHEPQEL